MQDTGCHRRARWSSTLVPSSWWCWTGSAGYHRTLFYVNLNINLRYLQNVYILLATDCRTGVHIGHHPCLVLLQPSVSRDIEMKQSQPKNFSLHNYLSHFCTLLLAQWVDRDGGDFLDLLSEIRQNYTLLSQQHDDLFLSMNLQYLFENMLLINSSSHFTLVNI